MRKRNFPWAFLLLPLLVFHSLSEPESAIAPMEKTEQEALYRVIQGFVGKSWNGSDLYPDPCGWTQIQGVACDLFDGLWYVTAISIGPILDNSLQCVEDAEFSPLVFQLKHLKSLSIFSCFSSRRQTIIPSSNWENLAENLETLELRSNRGCVGEIPADLGRLRNLQSLVLVENSLVGKLPVELGNLIHLKRLMLSGNLLSGPIPASLCNDLSELLILDLSRNSLTGSLPPSLCNARSLLKLDLSSNQLHGSLPPELGNLRHLTLLDLKNNSLSGASSKSLVGMESIQDLLLSHNPWGGSIVGLDWENLRNLTTLDLSRMGLTGTIPEAIASLKRLRCLALDNNRLSGSVSSKLAALPSLNALYLNGNNLTGELRFPERFYRRMGKKFAAWDNPYLCYNAVAVAAGHVPYGVAQCKQDREPSTYDDDSISNESVEDSGNLDKNSGLLPSFWLPALPSSISGFWWGIVAQEVVITMFILIVFL
ncbi:hypothetical protein BHE74_00053200 [Ensete ventricosum]|nr:hypothetical protein BHE74_00053200 [Ensete ventricosum]